VGLGVGGGVGLGVGGGVGLGVGGGVGLGVGGGVGLGVGGGVGLGVGADVGREMYVFVAVQLDPEFNLISHSGQIRKAPSLSSLPSTPLFLCPSPLLSLLPPPSFLK
jgi:hypothetical protein